MKRIIAFAALLLTFIGAAAQDGRSIYRKYSEAEDVSAVYISNAMFRMIGSLPDISVKDGSADLTPVIRNLKGCYIIDSKNAGINNALKADVDKFTDSGKFELLMEAKEKGEVVRMFTAGTEKTVSSFVMMSEEGSETTFICIDGEIGREELERLIGKMN